MSRKKSLSPGTATTVPPTAPPREAPAVPKPQTRSTAALLPMRIMRMLGSLHMAIILLSTAVVVLFLGSWLESKFDARISQEFVYRTWWFTVLLLLFAVNIFFAAAKKWPWKKHQIGFLITHVGLLTMLAGGIFNSLAGVDAQMQLLDSAYLSAQRQSGVSQQSDTIVYPDQGIITVQRVQQRWKPSAHTGMTRDGDEVVRAVAHYPFNPGVTAWGDAAFTRQGPLLVRFLDTLAHPLPRSWREKLPDGAALTVEAYYPTAVRDVYAATPAMGFPAVKVLLSSERLNPLDGEWIALDPDHINNAVHDLGPARIEMTGVFADELIPDFLQPPPADKLGPKGKLILWVAGTRFALDVADVERQTSTAPLPLGDTKWVIHSLSYKPAIRVDADKENKPRDPGLEFLLISPRQRRYVCRPFARVQATPAVTASPSEDTTPEPMPACLYQPPDFLFGSPEQSLKGMVQLAQSVSGKLYYRAFVHRGGRFSVDAAGPVEVNQTYDIWPFMKGQFEVVKHHRYAEWKESYEPRHERLGLRRGGLYTVFRCRLDGLDTARGTGAKDPQQPKSQEFYLAMGAQEQEVTKRVMVNRQAAEDGTEVEDFYRINYAPLTEKLGFEVKLLRAESQVDPGTDRDATYSSFVLVNDPPIGSSASDARAKGGSGFLAWLSGDAPPSEPVRREAMITMNQPLDYRGYKLYQSNFVRVTDNRGRPLDDDRGRPLHISGLTVGRDPGLWLKYLGSSMLALGIACMFYMRAYFFKPRGRNPVVGDG